jgi:para-nitrobenzyl esterase
MPITDTKPRGVWPQAASPFPHFTGNGLPNDRMITVPRLHSRHSRTPVLVVAVLTALSFLLNISPVSATTVTGGHATSREPLVRAPAGQLRGVQLDGADAFLGVPFAAPPVNGLRFAPPAPQARWKGIRDASQQSPACLQFAPGGVRETQATSEDCLYLDVYRPHGVSRWAKLPVIVWIHGGGFTQGTGVIYGGQTLASRTDSVIVSLNYRLGTLGALASRPLDTENPSVGSGNWATLDQIAALKWVRNNIRAFGGNPGNVTVAGQSAGGSSVCTLLASPKASGLFQRATVQSAYCGLGERSLSDAQTQGQAFAEQLGCADAATQLACLRSASTSELVAAFQTAGGAGPVTGTPTLPLPSTEAISTDRWNKVPVMIGAVAHEGKLFLSGTPNLTADDYQQFLNGFGSNAAKVAARYPLANYAAPFYAEAEAFGDSFIYCGVDRTAKLFATRTKTYRYEFDDPNSPTLFGFQPDGVDMSSTHSAELAYLFDFTLGAAPVPLTSKRLATQMKRYWGSFANNGNPNRRRLPHWPRYDIDTTKTLVLDPSGPSASTAVSQQHQCDFWADPDAN